MKEKTETKDNENQQKRKGMMSFPQEFSENGQTPQWVNEIRTPLNAVIGMTEMIARKTTEDEIRDYAGDIQQASNALLAIINDILVLSKIESGRTDIVESNYELGSLINDSYNMVAARWREKGLTATVICDPSLPRMLCGDEYHLRKILVNLLSNAVKYTNNGGVELRVVGEENGDILRLEVHIKDAGVGIRKEDIPRLRMNASAWSAPQRKAISNTLLKTTKTFYPTTPTSRKLFPR